jgi:hypothetical protein
MGVRFKFGGMAPLLSGEVILHSQSRFRAISSSTFPSYRIGIQLPPLVWMTLHVTNRRLLLVARIFPCITQEVDLWYPGMLPEGKTEQITKVCVSSGLFGQCVEVQSLDPSRRCRLIWSPELTLKFFCGNAMELHRVISNAMHARPTVGRQ